VTLDPENNAGRIDVEIAADSISTGLAELEKHLRGPDFLDAARFPKITFQSDKLIYKNGNLAAADGSLTLHGVTRPVHLTVDHFHCGLNLINLKNTCGANATAVIKRSEFGVDKYVPSVSDEVKIEIQIEAIKD
jgi:polyisoprenoid-binding protein YceI